MLRTNLATKPFYNDRVVRVGLAALALVALGLTVFNAAEVYRLQSQNRELVATGVRGASLHYRGSPLLAMQALRSQDRAVFFEMQRDEAGQLRKSLEGAARVRVESGDGFAGLRALLPPPERRGPGSKFS